MRTETTNGHTYTRSVLASPGNWSSTSTSAMGRQSVSTLDILGRVVTTSPPGTLLAPTSYSYDPATGGLATAVTGSGTAERRVERTYNTESELETVTIGDTSDGSLLVWTWPQYDDASRPLQVTLPDGRVVRYTYDANGNITSVTPPGRDPHIQNFTYADLLASYDAPNSSTSLTTQYTYNDDRQVEAIDRPDGRTLDLEYLADGRLNRVTDGIQTLKQYSYLPASAGAMLELAATPAVTTQYSYGGSRTIGMRWSGATNGALAWTFDNKLRVATQTVAGPVTNMSTSFGYNADDQLISVGAANLTYNSSASSNDGLLRTVTVDNITDTWTYNEVGEVLSHTSSDGTGLLFSEVHAYDRAGRIVQTDEQLWNGTALEQQTWQYVYDAAGRLDEVYDGANTLRYDYDFDANSNRIGYAQYDDAGALVESHVGVVDPAGDDRLVSYGGQSYTYDGNGDLATTSGPAGTTTLAYDLFGNLDTIVTPSGPVTYTHDASNHRVGRSDASGDTAWLYGGRTTPVAEVDAAGEPLRHYVYAGPLWHVPTYVDLAGAPARRYRLVTDVRGSVRLVVDSSTGTIMQRLDYSPFGRVLVDSNPGWQPFGFAGGVYDPVSGLTRFGARDYDAFTGRWTAKDPIRWGGGDPNLYGYVANDPVNRVDPSGLYDGPFGPVELWDDPTDVFTGARVTDSALELAGAMLGLAPSGCSKEDLEDLIRGGPEAPEFKKRKANQSGKEGATDIPSWAKGQRPYCGESGKEFAKRVMDSRFGEEGWSDTGPKSDFNRIKKFGDRAFEDC